ncbi:hypothetical protein J6590_025616 [Homalodisca vitripennis]|nr:hypothetical protein J6590_025616 [Homalodisca vitripennis]
MAGLSPKTLSYKKWTLSQTGSRQKCKRLFLVLMSRGNYGLSCDLYSTVGRPGHFVNQESQKRFPHAKPQTVLGIVDNTSDEYDYLQTQSNPLTQTSQIRGYSRSHAEFVIPRAAFFADPGKYIRPGPVTTHKLPSNRAVFRGPGPGKMS